MQVRFLLIQLSSHLHHFLLQAEDVAFEGTEEVHFVPLKDFFDFQIEAFDLGIEEREVLLDFLTWVVGLGRDWEGY